MITHPEIQRLEAIIKALGWKKIEFAERCGISTQVYNNWRKRGIPAKSLKKVADLIGVTREWLESGRTVVHGISDSPEKYMPPPTDVERYVTLYKKLDSDQRSAILHILEVMTEPGHTSKMSEI